MVFWENLFRYPRFFISSMIGLILILLNPIIKQIKNWNKNKILLLLLIALLITLFWVLKEMLVID
uniref:hypothetical protein n=1 Tax=Microzonia abyssicola TaxID=217214 RepID=UPI002E768B6F|nr:hypothetical protein V2497_pgp014 [Syringoderma abyssicola]WAM65075.1 hypothetical protein [Syringoderma abyssicola]